MPGLDMVMNIAKDALASQQYGIVVTGHNIANVNTEGYSRQRVVYTAKDPVNYGGILIGRGVDTSEIVRISDQFIENQLIEKKSNMLSSREMESYMQVLEGLFNESSGTSMSTMLADFWNSWHDIANNPSGAPERIALYEHSILLSGQFKALDTDLTQLETDLTSAVSAAIVAINQITSEIAEINDQIPGMETSNVSNDLRDKRNMLVSELGEYLDVKTFEQNNGSLTVVTARGCILVSGNDSYDLNLNGTAVEWESSGGTTIDITDYLTNGRLGGWLDMRDEIIAKYTLDLDAAAEEFIWTVNQQHSQGVGLELFQPSSSVTGTYTTSATLADLNFAGKIDFTGSFTVWVGDSNGSNLASTTINLNGNVDSTSTIAQLCTFLDTELNGTGIDVAPSNNAVCFTIDGTNTLGFSDDTSNILAALGVNTFFDGTGAGSIAVNSVINDKDYIAVARIDALGNYASGDNTNALSIADLQYSSRSIRQYTCVRGQADSYENVTATLEDYYHSMVGSIGIKSASISRGRAFNEVMVAKLGEVRDSISAVSLDEEMTNLIKFQQAYAAAAKLISVADEMLTMLLSVK